MSENSPIHTPWPLLLQRARYQLLPVFTMLTCATLAAWLWARNARSVAAIGEVSAVQVGLESKFAGMLEALPQPVKMFDSVKAGQIVARLDTSGAEAELRQIDGELSARPTDPLASSWRARADELKLRIIARDLKSPITGTVVEIFHWPGESAKIGKPIMTIASERGDFIIGYLRPDQSVRPAPGMVVTVRTHGPVPRVMRSYIQSVAPQVQLLPKRHLKRPDLPEWALPVQIAMPPEAELKPGELVDLVLRPEAK